MVVWVANHRQFLQVWGHFPLTVLATYVEFNLNVIVLCYSCMDPNAACHWWKMDACKAVQNLPYPYLDSHCKVYIPSTLNTDVIFWRPQWENTVRRKFEYGFFQITNAKKSCQITSRRQVIWRVFGMSDLEKPILTFPISQYSHCRKLQNRVISLQSVGKSHVHTIQNGDKNSCSYFATVWRFFLYQKKIVKSF